MISKELISKIASIATSILLFVLLIYFLPVVLMILGAIVALIIVTIFAMRFYLKKQADRMNFVFTNRRYSSEEQEEEKIRKMKDVTRK